MVKNVLAWERKTGVKRGRGGARRRVPGPGLKGTWGHSAGATHGPGRTRWPLRDVDRKGVYEKQPTSQGDLIAKS